MRRILLWTALSLAMTLAALAQGGGGGGGGGNPLAPLGPPPVPQGNPITDAKTHLGKSLFWDEQMSSTRTMACGSCHIPGSGGNDPRAVSSNPMAIHPGPDGVFGNADDVIGSPGVPESFDDGTYGWVTYFGNDTQVTGRKAPAATDSAYSPELFWDGRAAPTFTDPISGVVLLNQRAALESQAAGPPVSTAEMGHVDRDWQDVADRITGSRPLALASEIPTDLMSWISGRNYSELFQEAFGSDEVTPARIAMAIATYERTLVSDETPLDAELQGTPSLTNQERQGMNIFIQSDCARCHGGPTLSDNNFHYIGVRPADEDLGRFEVTGANQDRGRFRTPGLRNVALRPTFFHNGRFESLAEVVDFYDRGGDFDAPNKDPLIRPLNLTQNQKNALIAFLTGGLTDPRVAAEQGPFTRPSLYAESNRVPMVGNDGVPGSGGLIPGVIALEPPLAGNPSFTVGLYDGLGSARAWLVIDDRDPGTSSVPASGGLLREFVDLQGSGNGEGHGSISMSLPLSTGDIWFGRWYVEDDGAAGGLAVSPLFSFTTFGEVTEVACSGDYDGDGATSLGDLVSMVNRFGVCQGDCQGDIDGNGIIDELDFKAVCVTWLDTCQ